MKAILNTLSFALAAGYIAAEVAEAAGARLPVIVNAPNVVMAMTAVLAIAIMVGDYARKTRLPAYAARSVAARTTMRLSVAGVRRNGYSIRRGAEAARLATPSPVLLFRKNSGLRYESAA